MRWIELTLMMVGLVALGLVVFVIYRLTHQGF